MSDDDRYAGIRKLNLEALVQKYGSAIALAKAAGYSTASRISHIRGGKPMREKSARDMEKKLGLPPRYLDRDQDMKATYVSDNMVEAIQKILAAIGKFPRASQIPMAKLYKIAEITYDQAKLRGGEIDPKGIEDLLKLTE